MNRSCLSCSAALLLSVAPLASGNIRLPAIFADNMVLQRETEAPIWGWAAPGEQVVIRGEWSNRDVKVEAGQDGRWNAKLPTGAAGGPYSLTIRGQDTVTLKNVMLGEVWICSGQSNMEWTVGPAVGPGIAHHVEEIKAADHPNVRLFTVAKARSKKPEADCSGKWQPCSSESVKPFSASAYFFGRKLNQELNVPVGLIATSWGGTEVELWISEPGMRSDPELSAAIEGRAKAKEDYKSNFAAWVQACQKADPGWDSWAAPAMDDASWTPLPQLTLWDRQDLGNYDGTAWYRGNFTAPADWNGKPAMLELGAIDDLDVTWINGQQVGATDSYSIQRSYAIKPGVIKPGENTIAIRVHDFIAQGGFTLSEGQPCLRCGDKAISLGPWRYKVGVEQKKLKPPPQNAASENSVLYNAMIAPLVPLAIRGAIWYQGESNVFRAQQYRRSFPLMIADWRKAWGRGDFPFYFVQIAPFDYHAFRASDPTDTWPHPGAELREAQRLSLSTPNTGMIVTTDITDDVKNIHPSNKQDVGARLALWAMKHDYGRDVECSGPLYKSMAVEGGKIRLHFDHIGGGLVARDGELREFTIAGADKKFVAAQAKIDGDSIVVSSPEVKSPLAVRFGWTDTSTPNLFNKAGLPASTFRTDEWPVSTDGVKW
ncbi:MAG: beta galactosidase jelly roll domain-containing protein [Planctomycetes bacterium]|nr:beta galactosidase jelly roll domain-containing protein [Planctomycetota bacterium]